MLLEFKEAGLNTSRMNQEDIDIMNDVCMSKSCILWAINHAQLQPLFINDLGRDHLGLESNDLSVFGFEWFLNSIHPEDSTVVHHALAGIQSNPTDIYNTSFSMKSYAEEWRWIYTSQLGVNFDISGQPEVMIVRAYDIEDLINGQNNLSYGQEYLQKLKRFKSLTDREKQILTLIANEMTSQEIADELFIEVSTVHTHRKHIISKLKTKTSLGLVEYSLFFSEAQ